MDKQDWKAFLKGHQPHSFALGWGQPGVSHFKSDLITSAVGSCSSVGYF